MGTGGGALRRVPSQCQQPDRAGNPLTSPIATRLESPQARSPPDVLVRDKRSGVPVCPSAPSPGQVLTCCCVFSAQGGTALLQFPSPMLLFVAFRALELLGFKLVIWPEEIGRRQRKNREGTPALRQTTGHRAAALPSGAPFLGFSPATALRQSIAALLCGKEKWLGAQLSHGCRVASAELSHGCCAAQRPTPPSAPAHCQALRRGRWQADSGGGTRGSGLRT